MNVLEQVRSLENGKGVQYLLDCACKIFNNPIYMLDVYYNLIAASDGPMEIYLWNDLMKTGTLNIRVKEILAKEGVLGITSALEKPVYLEKKENWSGGIITMKIVNKDKNWVGQITMYDYYSPLGEWCIEAFGILADTISAEIHDYEYFTKLPIIFFEDTINKLLDRTAENTLIHHSQAQLVRNELEDYLYIAVISIERNSIIESVHRNRLEYFKSLLKTRYKSFRYAVYVDKIVMLMSSKHNDFYEALPLGKEYDLFEHNGLFAGISSSFENIYEFRNYYDQALDALKSGVSSNSGQRVFLYGYN